MVFLTRVRDLGRRLRGGEVLPASLPEPMLASTPEPAADAPPAYRGYIEAVSAFHVEGWVQNPDAPALRVPYAVALRDAEQPLAGGIADEYLHGLHAAGGGDGAHAFVARLDPPLDVADQARLEIRLPGGATLARLPHARETFEPVLHVAMDVVDNCNLRCPFCVYDYAGVHTTNFMDEATMDAALRLLPFTRDGEFWFSCLHEPTLHPRLTEFIDKVPDALRRKLFYTTNLAKPMPPAYFEWFAGNAMHHVNISIESLRPELYERMRKGARHRIFMRNWDQLMQAMGHGAAPPRLRYITMVYRSNLRELPELVRYLIEERRAWQVELRHTFDVPHLPADFRASEFASPEEWRWLRDQLAHYPADRVQILPPPDPAPVVAAPSAQAQLPPTAEAPAKLLPHRYLLQLSWNGHLSVSGVRADSRDNDAREAPMLTTNVRDIGEPAAFLDDLARRAA